jgi:D-inositol-3-phosphate glycosyltransferase
MGEAAALRARRYSWSITAARLRRLYADLTARDLVECR